MTGLYLHIPFCERKCSYCDFYSIERTDMMGRFVDRLCAEITMRPSADTFTSVFFGGGTPSLLSPEQLDRIVRVIRDTYAIASDAEWTMECNPGTVTDASLAAYRASGINRLSFGVQSFNENELQFLQRIHSADDADAAMRLARAAEFDNVNMDLMFALPPQTMESWTYSIERMLALRPDHISAYSLIFEPGTPLFTQLKKGLVKPHAEELDADMYAYVMQRLRDAGYVQYEVSNFALPGKQCRHNLTYWHAEPYLSVGPSAHGYLNGTRYWNLSNLRSWSQRIDEGALPVANEETLTSVERLHERLFLEFRADGIRLDRLQREFAVDLPSVLGEQLRWWLEEGLVVLKNNVLSLTQRGYQVCDELSLRMIESAEVEPAVTADQNPAQAKEGSA
jgi:oxygen-independent coproporphyrinogen-3 oxidase